MRFTPIKKEEEEEKRREKRDISRENCCQEYSEIPKCTVVKQERKSMVQVRS